MDTALPQKFSFILDRNLAKANYSGNLVCTSCDIVVLGFTLYSRQLGRTKIIPIPSLISGNSEIQWNDSTDVVIP